MTTDTGRQLATEYRRLGLRAGTEGRSAEARVLFEKAVSVLEVQATESPEDVDCQEALARTYDDLGRLAAKTGDLDAAASFFQRELAVGTTLAGMQASEKYHLARALHNLGNVALARDRFAEATGFFEQEMSEHLSRAGQPDAHDAYAMSICCDALARTARLAGAFDRAQSLCEQSISIRRELAEGHPSWERELAVTYDDLGLIALGRGRFLEAWAFCEHAMLVIRCLLETATEWESSEPEDSVQELYDTLFFERVWLLKDMSVICGNLGEIARLRGDTQLSDSWLAIQSNLDRLRASIRDHLGEDVAAFAEVASLFPLQEG